MIEQQTISRTEFDECIERIDRLRELKPNWDSYGASAISLDSIQTAKEFLAFLSTIEHVEPPRISASPSGYVWMAWESSDHDRELELEFCPESLEYLYVDDGDPSRDEEGETTDWTDIVRLLKLV